MARSSKSEKSDKIDIIASKFALIHGAPKFEPRPEGSITAAEYAEFAGISPKTAGDWLLALYKKGEATRTKVDRTYCYSLNE
jgi:Fic family protein